VHDGKKLIDRIHRINRIEKQLFLSVLILKIL